MTESVPFRTVVKFAILAIGLLGVIIYLTFQARYLIIGPGISLTEQQTLLQNQRQVELTGSAYNISHLWLNDRPIYTDAQGNFKEALVLENGYTIATLRAEDRYGRETTVTQEFVYTPASFLEEKHY
ncbi:MAG: hypothetical protein LR008_02150 [Candidatus Pacebacteria bacterium]|nr:hypothetical protein [Candidatus Paceibacterota bacterium]